QKRAPTAIRCVREGGSEAVDRGVFAPPARRGLDCQSWCSFLNRLPHGLMRERFRVNDCQDSRDVRRSLLEYLKPLATHRRFVAGETGDIAARTSKTCNKAATDRIADTDKHDRYISRDRLEQRERAVGVCHGDIGRTRYELCRPDSHLLRIVVPPLHLHKEVATLPPPELVEPTHEGGEPTS